MPGLSSPDELLRELCFLRRTGSRNWHLPIEGPGPGGEGDEGQPRVGQQSLTFKSPHSFLPASVFLLKDQ